MSIRQPCRGYCKLLWLSGQRVSTLRSDILNFCLMSVEISVRFADP